MITIDYKKVEQCKQKLLEGYFSNSIIESTINLTDFSEKLHHGFDFLKFGTWLYLPKDWFTDPSIYPDFAFSEIGRGIARGETKYIIEQISNCDKIETENISQFTYDHLLRVASQLSSKMGPKKMVIFLPIEYYKSLAFDWGFKSGKVRWEGDHFHAGIFEFKLFWSSMFLKFDKIIIAIKPFAQWVAKPSIKDRLEVTLTESEAKIDKMELTAKTNFNFRIGKPEEIRVISAPLPANWKDTHS